MDATNKMGISDEIIVEHNGHAWKLDNGKPVDLTPEEIRADIEAAEADEVVADDVKGPDPERLANHDAEVRAFEARLRREGHET